MFVYEVAKTDPMFNIPFGMHEMFYTHSKLVIGGTYRIASLNGIFMVLKLAAEYDETGRNQHMEKSTRHQSQCSPQTSIL